MTRVAALDALPRSTAGLQTKEEEDGSITVKMRLKSTKWQKWFGAPPEYDRQYVLDALGREVLDACDGRASVREIVDGFARDHNVSVPEAELAVTKYLKTLMAKGLIGMEIGSLS
ncbi:MAG: PqqD family protein [Candidatus Hydrogenedentes bacterium]|nr:PqqD family protein [Candidatus Hydrogenedentota bacterium]